MIEQTYFLDMIPGESTPPVVHVSQFDVKSRTLTFNLMKGGVAYVPDAGMSVTLDGMKPDNTVFSYPMTVDGSSVSIDVLTQMTVVSGHVRCEVSVSNQTGKIGSANFILAVEESPIDSGSISESDIPIFEDLKNQAQQAAASAEQSASDAEGFATDAETAATSVSAILPASAGTTGQVLTKTATGADWVDNQGLPSTGTTGQILTKTATGSEWANKYPSSGTAGQVLTKTATGEAWEDVDGLPAGGTTGQVLTKNSSTSGDASWQDVDGLPSGGTAGQVLTKNSSTDGDASWQTPQSGGGGTWGSITGTLSDQTDLQNALNAKANTSTLATVESTSTASQAYAVGDYLVYNGILYKVISAINSGETLTPNTNIEATTAGAELTSLNNGLIAKDWQYVGLISGTGNQISLPTGWKEIGVGMTLKHGIGGYAFYSIPKIAIEMATATALAFGGYNFGCALTYNSTAQTVTYSNYYSATTDLYFRVYVKINQQLK